MTQQPTIVRPSGPHDAQLAIVGARPGYREVDEGKPFVGPSGYLLWKLCPIPRTDVYVDNVRLDFSGTHATPTPLEVEEALPSLRARLERTKANCILALGAQALKALTGHDSIDHWRGSVIESTLVPGRKVVPAWHPAHIQHGASERIYLLDRDIKVAVEQSRFPEIRRRPRTLHTNPTKQQALDFIDALPADGFVVDIECPIERLDVIHCIGLAGSEGEAMSIPLCWGQLTATDLLDVWEALQDAFSTREIIGQNVGFDTWRLERIGFRIPRIGFDTMLAHHLLWPELGIRTKGDFGKDDFAGGHDLGTLVSIYTDHPYYKHLGRTWNTSSEPDLEQYWRYNCLDACLTYEVYKGLLSELREFGQLEYFKEHVMGLLRPVLRMQQRGLRVNWSKLVEVRERLELEQQLLQLRLNHAVGFACNVRSSPDIRYLIKDVLKLPMAKRTKGGAPSTDEETLRTLAYKSDAAPIFRTILDIRERRTLLSNFLQLEVNENGCYTAQYKIHGTDSGRLSSTSPRGAEGRRGPQLQNIPESARIIFIAREGFQFASADLRRAEAMFVAADANARDLLAIFETGLDLYCILATKCLGREVTKADKRERETFKRVVHASNYGMGPRRLIGVLRLAEIDIEDITLRGILRPQAKAEYFINTYLDTYPQLREWQHETIARARRDRTLHDALGRRRFFMGRMDGHFDRVVLSFRPQATITGVTNRALRLLDAQGRDVVLQVHDSIAVEHPIESERETLQALDAALTYPITLHDHTFTIPRELKVGTSWGDLHERELA